MTLTWLNSSPRDRGGLCHQRSVPSMALVMGWALLLSAEEQMSQYWPWRKIQKHLTLPRKTQYKAVRYHNNSENTGCEPANANQDTGSFVCTHLKCGCKKAHEKAQNPHSHPSVQFRLLRAASLLKIRSAENIAKGCQTQRTGYQKQRKEYLRGKLHCKGEQWLKLHSQQLLC